MSRFHRAVVLVATALMLAAGLYPHWYWRPYSKPSARFDGGYHFLLNLGQLTGPVTKDETFLEQQDREFGRTALQIDMDRLIATWLVIVLVAGGVILAIKRTNLRE
ncbi:MAG: hypothetical protein HYX78_13450 [Armatimonadetes bacterium]|nr:hypothetical protein [Armatimonadota bacterium]